MSMIFERKLPIPQEVKELYPLSLELENLVEKRKIELKQIFEGLKILFPDLKGVLNEIFELVKGDSNKKV